MDRLLFVVFIIICIYAFMASSISYRPPVIASATENTQVPEAVVEIQNSFNEIGTLVFYPNNVGPVPYIFYQDQGGRTVSKALVFPPYASPNNFSSWSGAHISVTGRIVDEHVVVSDISYLSGP